MASGQVGKASVSGTEDRRFESFLASHEIIIVFVKLRLSGASFCISTRISFSITSSLMFADSTYKILQKKFCKAQFSILRRIQPRRFILATAPTSSRRWRCQKSQTFEKSAPDSRLSTHKVGSCSAPVGGGV